MKKNALLICMSAIIPFLVVGITACDTHSFNAENSIAGTNQAASVLSEANSSDPSSSAFVLEANSSNTDVDLNADNSSTSEHLVFNTFSANHMDVTSNLQVTTGTASPSTDIEEVNPVYIAYQNTPQNLSYDGYNTISYSIGSTSYSASLSTQEHNMLDDLQAALDEAQAYGGPGPVPTAIAQTQTKKGGATKPLEAMSEQEIKKWLKEKGYKVKKLGNRRFQVIYKYNKRGRDKAMSITSVFDANTGKMEPGYTASKNGKVLSKSLSKKNKKDGKRHGKSKIKRKNGKYLLLDITQKENHSGGSL